MSNTLSAAKGLWYGYNAPFIGGNEGVMSRQVDEKLIRNDLLQLLLTSPGDRVMRPTFGTGIRRFVFELITNDTIDQLKKSILNAIQLYETRVTATDVVIDTSNMDDNLISIKVYGQFNLNKYNINNAAQLLVELKLPLNQLGQATSQTQVAKS
jgi:phage baseplate assembly protein W